MEVEVVALATAQPPPSSSDFILVPIPDMEPPIWWGPLSVLLPLPPPPVPLPVDICQYESELHQQVFAPVPLVGCPGGQPGCFDGVTTPGGVGVRGVVLAGAWRVGVELGYPCVLGVPVGEAITLCWWVSGWVGIIGGPGVELVIDLCAGISGSGEIRVGGSVEMELLGDGGCVQPVGEPALVEGALQGVVRVCCDGWVQVRAQGVTPDGEAFNFTTPPRPITLDPTTPPPSECQQPPMIQITSPDPVTFSFVATTVNGIPVAVPADVERPAGPIDLTATIEGPVSADQIHWVVVGIDGVSGDPPDPPNGAQVSFTPNPTHPPYTLGGGRRTPAPGLGYVVTASIPGAQDTVVLQQHASIQIKDIIVQEYVNHATVTDPRNGRRLPAEQIPSQSDLVPVQETRNFSAAEINQFHNYGEFNLIVGNPAQLAQQIRDEYNRRIYDDEQVVPVGTRVQSADTVVVSPGQPVNGFGPILDTQPEGDDQIVGNTVVAGPNLIAETRANNNNGGPTNFSLRLTSAWRNPERNENVSGVINSRHQFGDAVDLQPIPGSVPGKNLQQLYCILETAAQAVVGVNNAFAERGAKKLRSCMGDADGLPSHVHAEKN